MHKNNRCGQSNLFDRDFLFFFFFSDVRIRCPNAEARDTTRIPQIGAAAAIFRTPKRAGVSRDVLSIHAALKRFEQAKAEIQKDLNLCHQNQLIHRELFQDAVKGPPVTISRVCQKLFRSTRCGWRGFNFDKN